MSGMTLSVIQSILKPDRTPPPPIMSSQLEQHLPGIQRLCRCGETLQLGADGLAQCACGRHFETATATTLQELTA